jgi:hypothetical protein
MSMKVEGVHIRQLHSAALTFGSSNERFRSPAFTLQLPPEQEHNPNGSISETGRLSAYVYVLIPPRNPIGSFWMYRPVAGS